MVMKKGGIRLASISFTGNAGSNPVGTTNIAVLLRKDNQIAILVFFAKKQVVSVFLFSMNYSML